MNFTEWLSSTLGVTVSGGLLLSILIFLPKNWLLERLKNSIKSEYDKELETHKANLKRDYDVQIEKMKAEIAEKQFRFSHIFEKTATAIADTHQHLIELHDTVYAQVILIEGTNDPERKKLIGLLGERWQTFDAFYKRNRIFIPKNTDKAIGVFTNSLINLQQQYSRFLMAEKAQINMQALERHEKAIEDLLNTIPKLRSALVDEFQQILGFPIEDKKP